MKKIGLLGGIGPASTIEYYRDLVQMCREHVNIQGYPEIVIDSVDMNKHDKALSEKEYDTLAQYVLNSLTNLKLAGAEIAAITAVTEHIIWDKICDQLPLPTVNIVQAVIEEVQRQNYKTVLVLGTEWTMSSGIFEKALSNAGCTPIIPSDLCRKEIGAIIYPNLENGIVVDADKKRLLRIIEEYCCQCEIDAILLGCTELPLMIKEKDVKLPIIPATEIHMRKIVSEALKG